MPRLGLALGLSRVNGAKANSSAGTSDYIRPDGTFFYRRPDTTSLYKRP